MEYLPNVEWIILLIVAFIGILRLQKLSPPFKLLIVSVTISFILCVLSIIVSLRYKNNAAVLQIVCISEYVFYSLIYYYLFKNKIIKKAILLSILIISIAFLMNAVFFQSFLKVFPTNINIPAQILLAVFSLLLFKEMLLHPLKINIIKQGIFWYNTAILFFSTTMFVFLSLSNYLASRNLNDDFKWYFWYLIVDIFHLLLGVAILTDNNTLKDAW